MIPTSKEMHDAGTKRVHFTVTGVGHQQGRNQKKCCEGESLPALSVFWSEIHGISSFAAQRLHELHPFWQLGYFSIMN
jgi:hypothetical protein